MNSETAGGAPAAPAQPASPPAPSMPVPSPATVSAVQPAARGTVRQRLIAGLVEILGWLACRLPEGLLWPLADVAGAVSYRVLRERRERARRNLRRVAIWLDAHDLGSPSVHRAATDDRALERLVKAAFRNHARYYVETARTPVFDARYVRERLLVENPEEVDRALVPDRRIVLIGLHFGEIELPGFLAARKVGAISAPMETLGNPGVQRWIERTRSSIGLHLSPLETAALDLRAALRRNETVGLVGDRDLTGSGVEVELFGHPTKIPAGPVLLTIETGAEAYVSGVRRAGPGRYRGSLRSLPVPSGGTVRERVKTMAQAEAHLFERIIADAPEQWLSVFHPIWPDLEEPARVKSGEAS